MDGYFNTRFKFDGKRAAVWKAIANYLSRHIPAGSSVLELGAGYCDFINNIKAGAKYAVDTFDGLDRHAAKDVKALKQSALSLQGIKDSSIDVVFASNFFEHLSEDDFSRCMAEVRRVLRKGGRLIVVQPNYRYCHESYFDDYTHKRIFSHITMHDILEAAGFEVKVVIPRFLPFSMKSRLPKANWLVRLYLNMPYRPLAKQFLVVALKKQA